MIMSFPPIREAQGVATAGAVPGTEQDLLTISEPAGHHKNVKAGDVPSLHKPTLLDSID
jgi:hypothetical protein